MRLKVPGQPAEVRVPFTNLANLHAPIASEMTEAITRVVQRSWFVLGEEVAAFETEFAAYCGTDYCVGVGSGTEALHLALLACGVGPGDEVITVGHTFIATALAISWTGATPVLVDVDPSTYTMDPARVAEAITPRTRAIVPVHLYGQCADMAPIVALAERHELWVVEDAAQAHGATYNGRRAGALGHLGCFSFYPTKNLGALGDGGAITTRDAALDRRLRSLRNYGQSRKYYHEECGFNSRLDEIQAAVLRVKLRHLDTWNEARRRTAAVYDASLGEFVQIPYARPGGKHVYHLYVVADDDVSGLERTLAARGVMTQRHYPVPVHQQKAYARLPHRADDLRHTDRLCNSILSLPMCPGLPEAAVAEVVDAIRQCLRRAA
jgi:dTDP-4-amino-4,6-dideoxygalactose transaminase